MCSNLLCSYFCTGCCACFNLCVILKTVNGWIEVLDEESTTCYVKLETGEVRYERPPDWVKTMAQMFNDGQVNSHR